MALASLLPKPGSGAGGSNSILLLSSAMQQPIYVFENGKFLQSYGKGLGGTPITIGYDSKNQQYFGFTNKGSSNSGSIFEAISASSNGKYSADILRGVVQPIPVADTTPPKPPSQPTPQPKPLSQSELSAAQFLVDTLTADKRQLQAKENEYHRNILQIAKQNMHDSAVKKFARDEALMQQAYAIGGESIPRLVAPMEGRKTTADTDRNISEYFDNPNNKYANNQIIKGIAQAGEAIELAGSNLAYGISRVEGGLETLLAVGTVVGGVVDGVKDVAKGVAKSVLFNDAYENAAKNYNKLPRGAKIATEFVGDCGILGGVGKVAKLAGGEVINAFKGVAAEGGVLRSVAGASEISTGLGENVPTKPIPLEIKPTASSMLTKVEQKLPIEALEVKRVAEKISLDSATPLTATEKIVENPYLARSYVKEIEEITKLQLPDQQLTLLKEALQTQEFRKLGEVEQRINRNEWRNVRNSLMKEWEQNTGQKWPVYTEHPNPDKIGYQYDAHHIIQVDHGGPNTWWNIHPAHGIVEHKLIHAKDSIASEIFKPKKK